MDQARKQELIHADLDGTLSGAERAELARLLLQDPEARRLHDEIRRTDALLREVPPAEPPAGLRPAILKALGLSSAAKGSPGGGPPVLFRYAAAIAGGLLVVGLGYGLLLDRELGDGLQGSVTATARARVPVDEVTLHADGAKVGARLFHEGSVSKLELEFAGMQAVEVVGVYNVPTTDGAATSGGDQTTPVGGFTVVLTPASPRYAAELSGTGPIRLEIRAAGQRLDTATLGLVPTD